MFCTKKNASTPHLTHKLYAHFPNKNRIIFRTTLKYGKYFSQHSSTRINIISAACTHRVPARGNSPNFPRTIALRRSCSFNHNTINHTQNRLSIQRIPIRWTTHSHTWPFTKETTAIILYTSEPDGCKIDDARGVMGQYDWLAQLATYLSSARKQKKLTAVKMTFCRVGKGGFGDDT